MKNMSMISLLVLLQGFLAEFSKERFKTSKWPYSYEKNNVTNRIWRAKSLQREANGTMRFIYLVAEKLLLTSPT